MPVAQKPAKTKFEYQQINYQNNAFNVIKTDAKNIHLYWKDEAEQPYKYLSTLKYALEKQQIRQFALTNAGIYSKNYSPAGLFINSTGKLNEVNTKNGKGNFHLQPNGIFLINKQNIAQIITTKDYINKTDKYKDNIRLANQSGPLLVVAGKINANFVSTSQSRYVRNAVCVNGNNQIFFFISENQVTFYDFADFSLQLGCVNALYLDGSITKLYVSGTNQSIFQLSPFVGIFAIY